MAIGQMGYIDKTYMAQKVLDVDTIGLGVGEGLLGYVLHRLVTVLSYIVKLLCRR